MCVFPRCVCVLVRSIQINAYNEWLTVRRDHIKRCIRSDLLAAFIRFIFSIVRINLYFNNNISLDKERCRSHIKHNERRMQARRKCIKWILWWCLAQWYLFFISFFFFFSFIETDYYYSFKWWNRCVDSLQHQFLMQQEMNFQSKCISTSHSSFVNQFQWRKLLIVWQTIFSRMSWENVRDEWQEEFARKMPVSCKFCGRRT